MGITAGVAVYTYSTSRLLVFTYMLTWIVLYVRRNTIEYSVRTCIYFVVMLIPYIFFSLKYPGALTDRFKLITYIYEPGLSVGQKIWQFCLNYSRQFSPDFLLLHGDHNA